MRRARTAAAASAGDRTDVAAVVTPLLLFRCQPARSGAHRRCPARLLASSRYVRAHVTCRSRCAAATKAHGAVIIPTNINTEDRPTLLLARAGSFVSMLGISKGMTLSAGAPGLRPLGCTRANASRGVAAPHHLRASCSSVEVDRRQVGWVLETRLWWCEGKPVRHLPARRGARARGGSDYTNEHQH